MRIDANLVAYSGLLLLALVALAEHLAPVAPSQRDCRIGYVYDGDTVELICGERVSRARLTGFDAPELSDPKCESERRAAEAARGALRLMIRNAATVTVEPQGVDRYRRDLVRLRLDGRDVAGSMIAAGHARAYDGGKRGGWCH